MLLAIFQINDRLVRWVVQNKISDTQKNWLKENVGDKLTSLFLGAITGGGHGIGLSDCTDFVASSFGTSTEEALEQQYLGSKVIDDHYLAWFHWPISYPDSDDPLCECTD